ncbi:MAG: T9SS type A sorting domain-containing protein [Ignavibacteria bacterium]|nr:T9SS type A sorting domain-containing protein [Ignavibacteria bacterium]
MRKIILILAFVITHFTFVIENCVGQWVQMSSGMGTTNHVFSFAISGNNIFAGTYYGLWLTTNNGQTWTQTALNFISVYSLAISGNNIFAGCGDIQGIYLSTNNGQTWTQTALNNTNVVSLTISGNNIFAGSENYPYGTGGVYLSTNNGQNWTQTALNNKYVLSLAISGNNIFAGTGYYYGIYISSNSGTNWTQTALNNKHVYSIAISGSNIFAGTWEYGVYLSTNNGQNWTQTALNNKNVHSLAIYGNNIFAGIYYDPNLNGVWLSTNNGTDWIEKNQGFDTVPAIYPLIIANDYIFAGTFGHSVWRRPLSDFVGIKNISTEIPSAFSLEQNYPNPFNSNTIIRFQIKDSRFVNLKVFDMLGKEVATLVNEYLKPGTYETTFEASTLTGGIYFYRLQTENFSATKKLILLK